MVLRKLQWNAEHFAHLFGLGFDQSKHDPSLFIKSDDDGVFTTVVAYVLDLLVTESSLTYILSC